MADSATGRPSCRIGDRVRVRGEGWRVAAIDGTADCRLLTLTGLGPSNAFDERQFLEPFEDIAPVASADARVPGSPAHGHAPPALEWWCGRGRWRDACRTVLAQRGPWDAVHAADAAHIQVLPHQLEPARAVLRGDATRLLLADAVGLGKTVQAGLVLAELLRRGAAESALILTPAGLRDQWHHELRQRFALDSTVVDLRTAARRAAESAIGVSPWASVRVAISSVDFVKRPEVLPAVRARLWDVVIVDEAHLVAPGTDRRRAVAALCDLSLYVILLTATPHSGDRDAYEALCALGARGDGCLRFQRTRRDVQLSVARHVHRLRIHPTGAEQRMHTALERYGAAVRAECGDAGHAMLLLSILWKRALSSPESLRRSIVRRLSTLDGPAAVDDSQLRLPLDDGDGEFETSDDAPAVEGAVLSDTGRERQLLERLERAAVQACAGESKLTRLTRLLARLRRRRESVIVFTEYRDTLVHLQRTVAPDAMVLHGGLTRRERGAAIAAFTASAAATLLATDAAGEGLNLHAGCRCVVHLEVPWNPVRLEQRTGRVDRIGQTRTVHAFHLAARHRAEEELLRRLQTRIQAAQHDVAMVSPLESQAAVASARIDAATSAETGLAPEVDEGMCAEIERITLARALTRHARHAASPAHGRLRVVRARSRLRAALRGDALFVVDTIVHDDAGRRVAAAVVSLRVAGDVRRAWSIGGSAAVAAALASVVERRADVAFGWSARRAFWTAAERRAEAIARAATPPSETLFQPGLFDRRADRRRELLAMEQRAVAEAMARRATRVASLRSDGFVVASTWLAVVP